MDDPGSDNRKWYETWFDTKYYQILYQNRNEAEAALFVDQLLRYLQLPPDAEVMDAACGTGRYAQILAARGLRVTGIDLSFRNIQHASAAETDRLLFYVHDIRESFSVNYFDAVFSFFTSFGYFSKENGNRKAAHALALSLKKGGRLVIDFFNAGKVIRDMKQHQLILQGGILFSVEKYLERNTIVKKISLQDEGREFQFEERVQALTLADFKGYFNQEGLRLTSVFGSYDLQPFDERNSERLILIAEKT